MKAAWWIPTAGTLALTLACIALQQVVIDHFSRRTVEEHRMAAEWRERAIVAEHELRLERELSAKKDAEIEHWVNECAVRVLPPEEAERRFGERK